MTTHRRRSHSPLTARIAVLVAAMNAAAAFRYSDADGGIALENAEEHIEACANDLLGYPADEYAAESLTELTYWAARERPSYLGWAPVYTAGDVRWGLTLHRHAGGAR